MYNVIKVVKTAYANWSVALKRKEDELTYWVDVEVINGTIEAGWNNWLAQNNAACELTGNLDVINSSDELDEATAEAICQLEKDLELSHLEDGSWVCNISEGAWY